MHNKVFFNFILKEHNSSVYVVLICLNLFSLTMHHLASNDASIIHTAWNVIHIPWNRYNYE